MVLKIPPEEKKKTKTKMRKEGGNNNNNNNGDHSRPASPSASEWKRRHASSVLEGIRDISIDAEDVRQFTIHPAHHVPIHRADVVVNKNNNSHGYNNGHSNGHSNNGHTQPNINGHNFEVTPNHHHNENGNGYATSINIRNNSLDKNKNNNHKYADDEEDDGDEYLVFTPDFGHGHASRGGADDDLEFYLAKAGRNDVDVAAPLSLSPQGTPLANIGFGVAIDNTIRSIKNIVNGNGVADNTKQITPKQKQQQEQENNEGLFGGFKFPWDSRNDFEALNNMAKQEKEETDKHFFK
jgi:hypothetical protein